MKYKEVMGQVNKIWDALNRSEVDAKTIDAFSIILDAYQQWCHL